MSSIFAILFRSMSKQTASKKRKIYCLQELFRMNYVLFIMRIVLFLGQRLFVSIIICMFFATLRLAFFRFHQTIFVTENEKCPFQRLRCGLINDKCNDLCSSDERVHLFSFLGCLFALQQPNVSASVQMDFLRIFSCQAIICIGTLQINGDG